MKVTMNKRDDTLDAADIHRDDTTPKVESVVMGGEHASPRGKTVEDSQIVMARSMQPPDANVWGNVHGGSIMRLVDEAGGAVAIRHSRSRCVTVAMDSMTFKEPVYIGDLLTISACLSYVGRTSMEVEARIEAEDLRTGVRRHAGTSYLIYVAIDDLGRPTPVPPLTLHTKEERQRWKAAEERRLHRQREAGHTAKG
jgi:acyl-CoA hydrolase